MQLCKSFAGCQDCACIGVLVIASERFQLYTLLVGSQNVDPEDGACKKPRSAAVHSTALSQASSLSAFALEGRTQTPETRPVVVCAYQATNIEPCGRSARTSIEPRGQVLPLLGGRLDHKIVPLADPRGKPGPRPPPPPLWPCSPRGLPRGRRTERPMRVQPRACTSGCKKVRRRCSFGQST